MKRLTLKLSAIIIASIFVFSCNNEESVQPTGNGFVEFTISPSDLAGGLKEAAVEQLTTYDIAAAVISVKNEYNKTVVVSKQINVYKFNEYFISEPVVLENGSYTLTEFLLLDASGAVIYAAPIEGSEKAYLVNLPLPVEFTVSIDQTVKVVPEVLSIENSSPGEFGYSTFSFDEVQVIDFLVGAFVYNETIQNLELTEAHLEVEGQGGVLYSSAIIAQTNKITVNANSAEYKVTITKNGYTPYSYTFSGDSLSTHFDYPLTVVLLPVEKIELQPNSTDGKDALIELYSPADYENRNFGDYAEFNAVAWTASGTQMTVRSLIDFDLTSVPANSTIIEAKLHLYVVETSLGFSDGGHSQESGSNALLFSGITSAWDEMSVTWNTQPSITTDNQVLCPASESNLQDYEIDVTGLIKSQYENPGILHGIMMQLQTEQYYRRVLFASSDHADVTKHPKLVITYN